MSYIDATRTGDPGRTVIKENATKWKSRSQCQRRIDKLRKQYPRREFRMAKI